MAQASPLINEYLDAIASWVEFAHADTVAQPRYRSSRSNGGATSESSSVAVSDRVGANYSFPLRVEVTPAFEQSLEALSSVLTTGEERTRVLLTDGECPQGGTFYDANHVVERVASIPFLVKTILLIEDSVDMQRVLEYTIIRRTMLCCDSLLIGNVDSRSVTSSNSSLSTHATCWLIQLLRSNESFIRKRAVRYLEIVSEITLEEWIGDSQQSKPRQEDIDDYRRQRNELFYEICQLRKLIPLLFTLSREDVERACTTAVIQRDLDVTLHRPFGMTLVFLDFGASIITPVLYSFLYTNPRIIVDEEKLNSYGKFGLTLFHVILAYLVLRTLSSPVAICVMSWRVFRTHVLALRTLFELLTVGMAMTSYYGYLSLFWRPHYTTFLAVSKFLLWLRLLDFLAVVRRDLSIFIMTIFEVIVDLRWFILVIGLVIVAFSDMMFTIVNGGDGCGTSEACADMSSFCNKTWPQSVLEVYKVFVGDVGLDDYQQNQFTELLFVLLTFFGVIILLTMLIAVVDESYERSRIFSDGVFGRARFAYVVKLIALEYCLQPPRSVGEQPTCSISSKKDWFRRVFFWLVILLLGYFGLAIVGIFFGTPLNGNQAIISGEHIFMIVAYTAVCIGLYATVCVLFTYLITGWGDAAQPSTCFRLIQNNPLSVFGEHIATIIVKFLLGSSGEKEHVKSDEERVWHGRLRFIEESTRRIVHEAECRAGRKFDYADGCLIANRDDFNATIAVLEGRVATMNDRISAIDARTKSISESIVALGQLLQDNLAAPEDKNV